MASSSGMTASEMMVFNDVRTIQPEPFGDYFKVWENVSRNGMSIEDEATILNFRYHRGLCLSLDI